MPTRLMLRKVWATRSLVRDELPPQLTWNERQQVALQAPMIALALVTQVEQQLIQGQAPRFLPFYGPEDHVGLAWFADGFVPGSAPGCVEDLATALFYLFMTAPDFQQDLFELYRLATPDGSLPTETPVMQRVLTRLERLTREQPPFPRTTDMQQRKQQLKDALHKAQARGHLKW